MSFKLSLCQLLENHISILFIKKLLLVVLGININRKWLQIPVIANSRIPSYIKDNHLPECLELIDGTSGEEPRIVNWLIISLRYFYFKYCITG